MCSGSLMATVGVVWQESQSIAPHPPLYLYWKWATVLMFLDWPTIALLCMQQTWKPNHCTHLCGLGVIPDLYKQLPKTNLIHHTVHFNVEMD
jgi:hypothetical protein